VRQGTYQSAPSDLTRLERMLALALNYRRRYRRARTSPLARYRL
jgi:hypothetical protein